MQPPSKLSAGLLHTEINVQLKMDSYGAATLDEFATDAAFHRSCCSEHISVAIALCDTPRVFILLT